MRRHGASLRGGPQRRSCGAQCGTRVQANSPTISAARALLLRSAMKSGRLSMLLRAAALEALAVAYAVPLTACGGATEPLLTTQKDAAPSPSPTPPGPGPTPTPYPVDAGVVDSAFFDVVSVDVVGADVAPIDASRPDVDCPIIPAMSPCSPTLYSCLPNGLVLGNDTPTQCEPECGQGNGGCDVLAVQSGGFSVECFCGGGRFPAGLRPLGSPGGRDALGAFLAQSAALEAASVRAFEQLARELAANGAPASLVARARRSARQEVEHARLLRRAATARGCTVPGCALAAPRRRAPFASSPSRTPSRVAGAKRSARRSCTCRDLRAQDVELRAIMRHDRRRRDGARPARVATRGLAGRPA